MMKLKYKEEMVDTLLFEECVDMVDEGMSWTDAADACGIRKYEIEYFIEDCKEWKEEPFDTLLFEECVDMVNNGDSWTDAAVVCGIRENEIESFIEDCKEWKKEL